MIGLVAGALLGYVVLGGVPGTMMGAAAGYLVHRVLVWVWHGELGTGFGAVFGGFGMRASTLWGAPSSGAAEVAARQRAFFDATFGVMGHIAKSDGRVDSGEIRLVEALMVRMRLEPGRRREAIARFNEGKRSGFRPEVAIDALLEAAPGQANLFFTFLQIQMQMTFADGAYGASEERALRAVARQLDIPEQVFRQIEMIARMAERDSVQGAGIEEPDAGGAQHRTERGQEAAGEKAEPPARRDPLADAFHVLGVAPGAEQDAVKNAWRRQMSEHHPDKLASRGLPDEMLDLANERAQTIQRAWERIRDAKGWR